MEMRAYAVDQASALLRKLVFRVNRAGDLSDPGSIRDLRVAARRFAQCLRLFGRLFRAGASKKVGRRLRKMLKLTAEVRNRDIALQLCAEGGLPSGAKLVSELAREREQAGQDLMKQLKRFRKRGLASKWRKRLHL